MTRFIPYASPGSLGIDTEMWRADRHGNLIERVPGHAIGRATITFSEDTSPMRVMSVDVYEPDLFQPFREWLVPVITLSDPEGNSTTHRHGLYMVTPSHSDVSASGVSGTIRALDATQLLIMATRDDMVIQAGQDRGAFARQLAFEAGFHPAKVDIPDIDVIQAEPRAWEPGTTVYTAMTDILSGSNWYRPWLDLRGHLRTRPYQALHDIPTAYTYTNDNDIDAAELEGPIAGTPDWDRLANSITVRKMGHGDEPSIHWTERNENPMSPVSIPSLGFVKGRTVDAFDIQTEEDAQTMARNMLALASSHYLKYSLPTFPALDADAHETIGLEIGWASETGEPREITGRFWRTGYSLTLDGPRTRMVQSLARVEEFAL